MLTSLYSRVPALLVHVTFLLQVAAAPPVAPTSKAPDPTPQMVAPPIAPKTDAERIANTHESIKRAASAVVKIQARLDDPKGEYQKAKTDFEKLNNKLKDAKTLAAKHRREGKTAEATALEATLPAIQEDWQLAKECFDLAIRQHKASQDAIIGLKDRIAADKQMLDRLEGKTPPPAKKTAEAKPPQAPTPPKESAPRRVASEEPTESDKQPAATAGALPGMPGVPAPASLSPSVSKSEPIINENDPDVRHAREHLENYKIALHETEARVRLAQERVRGMERSLQTADNILQLDKESIAQAEKSIAKITKTMNTNPPTVEAERTALLEKLGDAQKRLAETRTRATRIADRVITLKETLAGLKDDLDVANKEAEAHKKDIAATEAEITALLSPTSPRNLFRWVMSKGPRFLGILIGMIFVHLLVCQFSRGIVRFITRNSARGSPEDRENRAQTLVGVFRYAAALVVFGGGGVMLLDELGVPVVPLMGGAAVIGLAAAFGAQNLIRDYFTGFMMLMEDQYSVNDVVRIGPIAGLVELITLRMTVLRDLEGIRHFIPHGTIVSVSNLTHGWSRARMDIPVAYKENVDRVIGVLMQLGRELRQDPVLGKHVLEDPEMLGVDELADSGVVIRFLLKTRPLQQWPIKREMLRRIKNRFDELGIEIPFPHQTVYHHFPDGAVGNALPMSDRNQEAA